MKPEILSLSAFGPYGGNVEVDFSSYSAHQLFLIDGPTGAGKTSLLDGMCFALYGEVPGARDGDGISLRSGHAEPSATTEVSLTFSLGSRRYRVQRTPAQERAKKRGTGVVQQGAQALLEAWEEDAWKPLGTKVSEVNEQMQTLLGLTCAQFKQVLLLPQGEFREFLLAHSDVKEALLEKLFGTTLYKEVSEELKRRKRTLEESAKETMQKRRGVLDRAGVENLEGLQSLRGASSLAAEASAKQASESELAVTGLRGRFAEAKMLHTDLSALAASRRQLAGLEGRSAEMAAAKERLLAARRAEPVIRQAMELQKRVGLEEKCARELVTTGEAVARLSKLLESTEKEASKLPEWHAAALAAASRAEALTPLVQVESQLAIRESALQKTALAVSSAQQQLAALEQKWTGGELRKAELEAAAKRLAGSAEAAGLARIRVSELQAGLEGRRRLDALRDEEKKASVRRVEAKEAFEGASRAVEAAEAYLETGRKLREQHAAAELASGLVQGEACPVCGSSEHPHPAVASADAVSTEQLEARERDLGLRREEKEGARQRLSLAEQAHAAAHAHAEAQAQTLGESAEERLETLAAEHSAAAAELQRLEVLAKEEKSTRVALEAHEGVRETLRQERSASEGALAEAVRRKDVLVAEREALLGQLRAQVPEGASAAALKAEVVSTRASAEEAIAALEKRLSQARLDLRAAEAQLEAKTLEAKQRSEEVTEARLALAASLSESGFASIDVAREAGVPAGERERLELELTAHQEARAEAAGRVAACEAKLGEKAAWDLPELGPLEEQLKDAETVHQGAIRARADAQAKLKTLEDDLAFIAEQEQAFGRVGAELSALGSLSRIVSGENAKNLSLQRFVLASRMDEVAIAATQRLLKMSRGRYELIRSEAIRHKGRQAGLELAVRDRHLGSDRYVQTLSGGEMFLASLALALGLADVVTRRRGAVQLDALFIDEGFGTLDDETLDQVMRTLEELRAGGRLIGVISHVTELKQRIPARLTVSRTARGSVVS